MSIQQATRQLLFQLYHIYDDREAANIADWVMEHVTGWKKIDRVINKQVPLSAHSLSLLEAYTKQLLAHKPVQYVLNEAWFFGLKFFVNEQVLIPRPETEELVDWIITDIRSGNLPFSKITDIGTGSGCIPVSLKKNLPATVLAAVDISEKALELAKKNAEIHQTPVSFFRQDVLDKDSWHLFPPTEIIVSNPPYIGAGEKTNMAEHVLRYEPHLALFVEDADPLRFYKAIADLALQKLQEENAVYVEINERYGEETVKIFLEKNFREVILKKDMQGRDRMIRAIR
jgi:release factor glutamine methyltransferase